MAADPNATDPTASPTPAKPGEQMAERAKEAYRWWDNLATLHPEDPFLVGAAKIGVRVVGIIVLLALSPLILLGLAMALVAVA